MRKLIGLVLFAVVTVAAPASAFEPNYVTVDQVNLAILLAPPPDPQSEEQRLDLNAVLDAQRNRTPQQAERAVADNQLSPFYIMGGVLGPVFTSERQPKLDAFLQRVNADSRTIFFASKDSWNRPRPFTVSQEVQAIGELPKSASYPSGHAMRGYLSAIILSNMVPEKRPELFARAWDYGQNRIITGVHFPTDIDGGRIGATVAAAALMQNVTFRRDFAEAKAELRAALGLPK